MSYRIKGKVRATGAGISTSIEGKSESEARAIAQARGIDVAEIIFFDNPPTESDALDLSTLDDVATAALLAEEPGILNYRRIDPAEDQTFPSRSNIPVTQRKFWKPDEEAAPCNYSGLAAASVLLTLAAGIMLIVSLIETIALMGARGDYSPLGVLYLWIMTIILFGLGCAGDALRDIARHSSRK